MRRTASEVLRSLEKRVARLERSTMKKQAGFSSFLCMACGKSIVSHYKWDVQDPIEIPGVPTPPAQKPWSAKSKWMSEIVAVFPNGHIEIDRKYEGSGSVNGKQLPSTSGETLPASIFHLQCWEKSGKPGYVGDAEFARDQGWFLKEPRTKPKAMGEDKSRRKQLKEEQKAISQEISSLSPTEALSKVAYMRLEEVLGTSNYDELGTQYLEGVGSRAGQFHFFVIWFDKDSETYLGGSAYGKLSQPAKIKAVEIARDVDIRRVEEKVNKKYKSKVTKYPVERSKFASGRAFDFSAPEFVEVAYSPIKRPFWF